MHDEIASSFPGQLCPQLPAVPSHPGHLSAEALPSPPLAEDLCIESMSALLREKETREPTPWLSENGERQVDLAWSHAEIGLHPATTNGQSEWYFAAALDHIDAITRTAHLTLQSKTQAMILRAYLPVLSLRSQGESYSSGAALMVADSLASVAENALEAPVHGVKQDARHFTSTGHRGIECWFSERHQMQALSELGVLLAGAVGGMAMYAASSREFDPGGGLLKHQAYLSEKGYKVPLQVAYDPNQRRRSGNTPAAYIPFGKIAKYCLWKTYKREYTPQVATKNAVAWLASYATGKSLASKQTRAIQRISDKIHEKMYSVQPL